MTPPAPWHCDVTALIWLSPRLRLGGRIRYHGTPVGPYDEVFAAEPARALPPTGHVPFMAVDSAESVAGGRGNWALPKEPAEFAARGAVRGDGWGVRVTARVRPRRLPAWAAARCAQRWPDGRVRSFGVRSRGRARLASVTVEPLPGMAVPASLPVGRFPGVLVDGTIDVLPPRG